jgi:predicted nucleic acid-binding Zn ribbon protein
MSDPPRRRCPDCRGKVIRLISGGGGVIFNGNGFHVTDYRSADYKKQAEADKPKPAGDSSSKKKDEK